MSNRKVAANLLVDQSTVHRTVCLFKDSGTAKLTAIDNMANADTGISYSKARNLSQRN